MTDSDCYAVLAAILEDLEGVERVWLGGNPPQGEQARPLIWIVPKEWKESDEVDPSQPMRTCNFEVRVITTGEGGCEQYQATDQLVNLVCSRVRGQDLDNQVVPGLTEILKGKVEYSYPEETHVLVGTMSYLVGELLGDGQVERIWLWGTCWERISG